MQDKQFFWFDTETSGTDPKLGYQILSLAFEVENSCGEILDTLNLNIRLKNNYKIDENSLKVNKINPFSLDFIKNSIDYNQAYFFVKNFILKNYNNNCLNIGIAYKAEFDINFFEAMFLENKDVFSNHFDKIICPYALTKKMTKSNKILSQIKYNPDGSKYRVCSLIEVSKALNTQDENIPHTALGDVKIMKNTIKKVWKIAYNQAIFDKQDINRFNELQIYPKQKGNK